ncbi:TlpA family protein disulfide reductase [Pseudomonadota bacterium]
MISAIQTAWRRFRAGYWRSLAFDALLIGGVFFAVHAWQTRNLPIDEPVPETVLALLDGSGIRSAITQGEAGVVYFFAPWCFYCRHSISNLDELVADGRVAWGTVIALDYTNAAEVQEFIDKTGVTLPVLMGTSATASDWSVSAFPTYYVIDAEGRIYSQSVGYSTKLGMWLRAIATPWRDGADDLR